MEFNIFELDQAPSFILNRIFDNLKQIYPKRVFFSNTGKSASPSYLVYSNQPRCQISYQKDDFDFLDHIFSKRVFFIQNRKSEHHH